MRPGLPSLCPSLPFFVPFVSFCSIPISHFERAQTIGRLRSHPVGDRCRPFSLWSGRTFGDRISSSSETTYRASAGPVTSSPSWRVSWSTSSWPSSFSQLPWKWLLAYVRPILRNGTTRDASSRSAAFNPLYLRRTFASHLTCN